MTVELLGADESRPGVRELVQATLDLVRGLGLADTITDDARRRNRILDRWADHPRRGPDGARMNDLLERRARRPRRRGRPARTARRRPRRGGLADRRRRPPAGTSPTQIAHLAWTDEAASVAATDKAGVGRARARGASPTRTATSTPRRSRSAGAGRRRSSTAGAPARAALADDAARATPRARRCRGSARRCRPPRWRPPGSWRPGRTALDVHEALGVDARDHRPDPARRPPRRPHPRLRLRRARRGRARRGVPRRAGRASGDALDLGPGGRRADGDRVGVRLLPAGHPARPPRRHRPGRRPAPTPTAGSTSRRPSPARPGEGRAPREWSRGAMRATSSTSVRIGNCSGFYGDRLSAMREMLEGGRRSTCSPATTSPS